VLPGMKKWRRVPEKGIRYCRGKSFREIAKQRESPAFTDYGLRMMDCQIRLRQSIMQRFRGYSKFRGPVPAEVPVSG
jgi:hypothetical protein